MPTRRGQALNGLRSTYGRLARGRLDARVGYVYAWRRALAHTLQRASDAGSGPVIDEITLDGLAARAPGTFVHECEPAETIPFSPPPVYTTRRGLLRGGPTELRVPPMRVLDLPGGAMFGRFGHVGPNPETLITDMPTVFDVLLPSVRRQVHDARVLGQSPRAGTTASLLNLAGGNYAHASLQVVPSFQLLSRVVDLCAVDRYLVPSGAPTVVHDALAASGVPADRVEPVDEFAPTFVCERLLCPTVLPDLAGMPPWAHSYMNDLFVPQGPIDSPERIFVIRPPGTRRQIVNGDAVHRLLEAEGFTVTAMEGLTVREQAACFANAKVIVGEHGAALANLAYARPGTRVVELVPVHTFSWVFPLLAVRSGLDHHVLVGTEPVAPGRLRSWQVDADQVVDVARLRELVRGT